MSRVAIAPADAEVDQADADLDYLDEHAGGDGELTVKSAGREWRSAAELIAEPVPPAVVEGCVWADSRTVLTAESGAGKTFLALDMGAAVSSDLDWHGRRVRHGSVVYVAYEGHVGLRLQALRDVGGHYLEHFYVVRGADPLSPVVDRDRNERPSRGELELGDVLDSLSAHLAAGGLPSIALVVIDTVRASLAGSEDSSEQVSGYLRAVRRVQEHAPGAGLLLVHHAGWQDGQEKRRRERGSSAFRGNVDCSLFLETEAYDRERGTARLVLTTLKARDEEALPPLHLVRRRVEVPALADRWGNPVTSCLIESDRRTPEERTAERETAAAQANQVLDLRVLRAIAERPELSSSVANIRDVVGGRQNDVGAAVARLVTRGWVLRAKQRQPFAVTPAGQLALGSRVVPSRTESYPNGAGTTGS